MKIHENLAQVLNKMSNTLAHRLLAGDYDKAFDEFKLIKTTDQKGMVVVKNIKDKKVNLKVGRFLSKLYEIKGREAEQFLEEYMSYQPKAYVPNKHIEIVEGEDLIKWYHNSKYGSSFNSCSAYSNKPEAFYRILADNPKQVKLLGYFKNNDYGDKKLHGRCLLWYLDDGNIFMDRIYTGSSLVRKEIREYCSHNNFLIRTHDESTRFNYLDDISNNYFIITEDGTIDRDLVVTLENVPKKLYASPYLDSITYFNHVTGRLSKYPPESTKNLYRLQVYGGVGEYYNVEKEHIYRIENLNTNRYYKTTNNNNEDVFMFTGLILVKDDKKYEITSYNNTTIIAKNIEDDTKTEFSLEDFGYKYKTDD